MLFAPYSLWKVTNLQAYDSRSSLRVNLAIVSIGHGGGGEGGEGGGVKTLSCVLWFGAVLVSVMVVINMRSLRSSLKTIFDMKKSSQ